jgi:PKD repeat protein
VPRTRQVAAIHGTPWLTRRVLACLGVVAAAGCGGSDLVLPDSGGAASIRVVEGDGQRGAVGEPLGAPVVVEVTDADGGPVAGVSVGFALTSAGAGAEITPATAATNAQGRAQAHVLLGDKVGLQTGEAKVVGDGAEQPSTTFAALAESAGGGGTPPIAGFSWECDGLDCRFSDASSDNGTITGRAWSFGDGSTSTARNPSHTYDGGGSYSVTLAVTDDEGSSDIATNQVRVTAPSPSNQAPHAEFSVSCTDLTCRFTDQSSDADGSVASRAWDFGDGATSTQKDPSHTYAAAGRYIVTLRATDDDGAGDSQDHPASPTAPAPDPNDPPHAEFEVTCQDLRCAFVDRSDDGDGSVVGWAWDFGDGSTSSERNPSHTYAAAGRYTVLLVATDDDGAADTRAHDADPTAPPTDTNEAPRADFDVHCDHQSCEFSDKSKDDDGAVVSWLWSFGDGVTSTEQKPTHTYAGRGHYDVVLTVTDDDGASASKTKRVDIKH